MNSMTGFGRADAQGSGVTWNVEISSVNRKQLEIVANLPRELAELEPTIRAVVAAVTSRGRINISLRCASSQGTSSVLKTDLALAKQYASASSDLALALGLPNTLTLADTLRWPGVLELERPSLEAESSWPLIQQALHAALKPFLAMRSAEGQHLHHDIQSRLEKIAQLLTSIAEKSKLVPAAQHKTLVQRLQDASLPVDLSDERLLKELALYADRCDISEELTRAQSHLTEFAKYLASRDPMGRSMDFLTQELAREFNTIGSKANNAELAHLVVAGKSEIEKIREQVQNIE